MNTLNNIVKKHGILAPIQSAWHYSEHPSDGATLDV